MEEGGNCQLMKYHAVANLLFTSLVATKIWYFKNKMGKNVRPPHLPRCSAPTHEDRGCLPLSYRFQSEVKNGEVHFSSFRGTVRPNFAVSFLTNRLISLLLFTLNICTGNSEKEWRMVSVRLLLVGPVGSENVIPFSSGIPTGIMAAPGMQ